MIDQFERRHRVYRGADGGVGVEESLSAAG
jgi:hypothetical protein